MREETYMDLWQLAKALILFAFITTGFILLIYLAGLFR